MAQQWEYQVHVCPGATPGAIVAMANVAGRDGWELASLWPNPLGNPSPQVALFFKRPKSA